MLQRRRGIGSYRLAVTASRPMRISPPSTLARLLGGWFSGNSAKIPEIPGLEGQWVQVKGGGLPTGLVARIDRAPDGRFVITGLLIGLRERREITWETLRHIKPASVLEQIFKGFDPKNPTQGYYDPETGTFDVGGTGQAAMHLWQAAVQENPPVEAPQRAGAGSRGAAPDLQAFADAYLRHLAARPHGAMSATARELHISRATAIRRAEQCRAAGLLPPKGRTR